MKNALSAFVAIAIAVFGCASTTASQQTDTNKIVSERLGASYSGMLNTSKSHALYQQNRSGNDHANRSFKYLVIRLSDNAIVHEGSFRNGYVKWQDEAAIEVASADRSEQYSKKVVAINNLTHQRP